MTIIDALARMEQPRILVYSNRGFGDLICDTLIYRAFRDRLPHAHIGGVVSGAGHRSVFADSDLVDRFFYFDTVGESYFKELLTMLIQIRRFRPDLIFVSTGSNPGKAPLMAFWSAARFRIGEDASRLARLYTHRCLADFAQHKVLGNWDLLRLCGIDDKPMPQIKVLDRHRDDVMRRLGGAGAERGRLIVLHPGSSGHETHKRWPAERFAVLADALADRYRARVVFVGDGRETQLVEQIRAACAATTASLAGALSIQELAALAQQADLLVGNDSGPAHIAAAVGCPTLTLFGPTNAARTRPYGPNSNIVSLGLDCSPCYPGLPRGCGNPRCLLDLDLDRVLAAIGPLMEVPPRTSHATGTAI